MKHNQKFYLLRSLIAGAAVFILMMLLFFSLIQTRQNNQIQARNLESLQAVSGMAEYVKYSIETRLMILHGYEAFIMTDPDTTEASTLAYLENLIGDDELIKNVGIIKDTTILFNYPKDGNSSAIGVDIATIPEQRDALLKVKATLQPVFFGPVYLVQGGRGFIARMPILIDGSYWGQISIVLKADKVNQLFADYASENNLEIAIFQDTVDKESLILGNLSILGKSPIINTVSIMNTSYVIAALNNDSSPILPYRYLGYGLALLASFLVSYLVFFSLMKSAEIKFQASIDSLTQVHNRSYLDFFLKNLFPKAKQTGTMLGIIEMDIDHFKSINDNFGHLAGDAALKLVSDNLLSLCRKTETVFRMGGDEFLIVFQDLADRNQFEAILSRIVSGLPTSFRYNDQDIPISLSMGHALYPEDGAHFDAIFKFADQQMYAQKKKKAFPLSESLEFNRFPDQFEDPVHQ